MRLPKRRWVRVALYVVSVGLVLVAVDLALIVVERRVHPGRNTTVITEPVLADGRVDYLGAIDGPYREGVTVENNALGPIVRAIGVKNFPKALRGPVCAAVGVAPVPGEKDPGAFVDLEEYVKERSGDGTGETDTEPFMRRPWRAGEHRVVAEWVGRNGPALELLHEAAGRERYYYPYGVNRPELLMAVLLPDLNAIRAAVDGLLVRGVMRAGEGDVAGAVSDVRDGYRIAALYNQSPIGITRQVAERIDIDASVAARAVVASVGTGEVKRVVEGLGKVPELPGVGPVMDREERFLVLDCLQVLARQNPKRAVWTASTFVFPPAEVDDRALVARYCFPVDYDAQMRVVNGFFDELVAAVNRPTYAERKGAMDAWEAGAAGRLTFLLREAPFLPAQRIQGLRRGQQYLDEAVAERALTRAAFALAMKRAEMGRYPQSLGELGGDVSDPYTGRPLVYAVTAGGYSLRSVGANMTDDKGKGDDVDGSLPLQAGAGR